MAFDRNKLLVLARAGSFTAWHYALAEDELIAAAHLPGFFNIATGMVATGDIILMTGPDGGALRCVTTPARSQGVRLAALT